MELIQANNMVICMNEETKIKNLIVMIKVLQKYEDMWEILRAEMEQKDLFVLKRMEELEEKYE
jgi:hypothetical protein